MTGPAPASERRDRWPLPLTRRSYLRTVVTLSALSIGCAALGAVLSLAALISGRTEGALIDLQRPLRYAFVAVASVLILFAAWLFVAGLLFRLRRQPRDGTPPTRKTLEERLAAAGEGRVEKALKWLRIIIGLNLAFLVGPAIAVVVAPDLRPPAVAGGAVMALGLVFLVVRYRHIKAWQERFRMSSASPVSQPPGNPGHFG